MPLASAADAQGSFTIDRVAHAIRFERDLQASPEKVFEAWTQPEQISLWWDPAGEPLERCDIDLRVGGAFTFISRGHPMPFAGVYREIARPDRLVFEAMGSTGRVLLASSGGGTRMIVEIACASAEQLEQFIQMNVHEGTSRTLDNLVAHLAG
jgi:uncharacterized protein YndB with AHSA1/START domain